MLLGDYRIEIVPDTEFRLDGGAMFGIVPRVLWEKVCPPDDQNRIRMASDCLFVETPTEKILIETGMGEKWSEKLTAIYGIRRTKTFAESLYERTGFRPEDITIVVNTHLHFDHCGGNTVFSESGETIAQFPNARYLVSEYEFKHAENPYERDRASYISDNWEALKTSEQLELKPSVYEVAPGITMTETRGHNSSMQTVKIESKGEILYSFSDLIPTTHHIPLAWIMGYDLFPLETLENKKKLLPQAVAENWLCWFYHDPNSPICRLQEIDGKLKVNKI
ncbi:MAG TPA: MBL fold metallo-hydrolase [Pyrinomonadaceae bacterium]|jgi:glyoxylase-like metal-dependent hydrolase (beta-lactamase superfamily II)